MKAVSFVPSLSVLQTFYQRFTFSFYLFASLTFFLLWEPSYASLWSTIGLVCFLLTDVICVYLVFLRSSFKPYGLMPTLLWMWVFEALAVATYISYDLALSQTSMHSLAKVLFLCFLLLYIISLFYRFLLGLSCSKQIAVSDATFETQRRAYLQRISVSSILFVLILIFVNYIGDMKNPVLDLSPGNLTLTKEARQIIESIDKPVELYAFLPDLQAIHFKSSRLPSPALYKIAPDMRIFLSQIPRVNAQIKLSFHNADLTSLGSQYPDLPNIERNGVIVIRSKLNQLDESSVHRARGPKYSQKRLYYSKDLVDLEKDLIRALLQVSSPAKTIYFTTANGERHPFGDLTQSNRTLQTLRKQLDLYNFRFAQLDLVDTDICLDEEICLDKDIKEKIPKDLDVLAINAPTVPFSSQARGFFLSYLDAGGALFVSIDPSSKEDFRWLLASLYEKELYQLNPEILTNTNLKQLLATQNILKHDLTATLRSLPTPFLALVRHASFERLYSSKLSESSSFLNVKKLHPQVIAYSPANTHHDRNKNGRKDRDERVGRRILGLAYSKKSQDTSSSSPKLLIYAGTDWLSEAGMRFPLRHHNALLATDSFLWLVESNLTASLKERPVPHRSLVLSDQLKRKLFLYGLIAFPITAVFILTVLLYFYRRHAYKKT